MLRKTKLHDIFQEHILSSSELVWSWLSLTLHWEVTRSGLTNVSSVTHEFRRTSWQ